MDFFKIAEENTTNLKEQYEILVDRHRNAESFELIDVFTKAIIDNWTVSINMGQTALYKFLKNGKYNNVYDRVKETQELQKEVGETIEGTEELLRKYLKEFYEKRMIFDNTFQDSEKFKYGAVYIGGFGLPKYGDYCVVISHELLNNFTFLACLKADSLIDYITDILDIDRLSKEISCKECVHMLVVLKHEREIAGTSNSEWSYMINNNNCYVETVTKDDIFNTSISCIRMCKEVYKAQYRKYFDYFLNKGSSYKLSQEEREQMLQFDEIMILLEKLNIKLEGV